MPRPSGPVARLLAASLVVIAVATVAVPARATTDTPAEEKTAPDSVVFANDPSQALVIQRATGLLPLVTAASDVLPLAVDGIRVAGERLQGIADLMVRVRLRNRAAAEALAKANRLVGDNVRDVTRLRSSYDDALDGISSAQRRRLERDAKERRNRSAVIRHATSTDWVCPVSARTKFRDSWHERRSGNRLHEGVDLVGIRGDPVLAPVDGVVSHRWDTIGGWSFDLVATDGDYWFGTHLSGLGKSGEVEAGDVIGFLGDTGNAQGVHLHFEYHPGGRENPVNAYPIVDARCTNRVEMGRSLYD
ncbi:MAG: M23 family metallopeptidase [Actinomycetota bacterium]|nr:M23 family metallopeptidase [Actinomycetota bacterium]